MIVLPYYDDYAGDSTQADVYATTTNQQPCDSVLGPSPQGPAPKSLLFNHPGWIMALVAIALIAVPPLMPVAVAV